MQSSFISSLWGPDLVKHFRDPLAFGTVEVWSSFHGTLTVLKLYFHTSPSEDTEGQEHTRKSFLQVLSSWFFFVYFTYCRAGLLIVGLNIDFSALKNWRHNIFFCHVLNMFKMKKALHDHIFPLQKSEQLAQQVLSSICIIYCKMYIISLAESKSTNTSINLFMNPYVILDVDGVLLQQDIMLNNWCRCTVAN